MITFKAEMQLPFDVTVFKVTRMEEGMYKSMFPPSGRDSNTLIAWLKEMLNGYYSPDVVYHPDQLVISPQKPGLMVFQRLWDAKMATRRYSKKVIFSALIPADTKILSGTWENDDSFTPILAAEKLLMLEPM